MIPLTGKIENKTHEVVIFNKYLQVKIITSLILRDLSWYDNFSYTIFVEQIKLYTAPKYF